MNNIVSSKLPSLSGQVNGTIVKNKALDISMFFSLLFIGTESWNIDIGGFAFKIIYIFLFISMIILVLNNHFRQAKTKILGWFVAIYLISSVFSLNITYSFIYIIYLLFSIFAIFYVFYSYVIYKGVKSFLDIFRKTLYIQAILVLSQFFLEFIFNIRIPLFNTGTIVGIPRPAIWFYETGYLATFLSFWLAFSCYMYFIRKRNEYLKDVFLVFSALVFTTSTTAYLAIFLVFGLLIILLIKNHQKSKAFKIVIIAFAIGAIFWLLFPNIVEIFVMRLFSANLDAASGGRITTNEQTWKVFLDYPIFGVGPNAYFAYFESSERMVAHNVTLELLATVGIFGALFFYGFILAILYKGIKQARKTDDFHSGTLIASVLGITFFMIVLQVNQGYLRPYMWMFFGILEAQIFIASKQKKLNNLNISIT